MNNSTNSCTRSWFSSICAIVLLFMPIQLFAPDHDPRATQQAAAQRAALAHVLAAGPREPEELLPAGVSFYLTQYGARIPVLGTDRRVLKFIYLGPELVQED
jgi:hypothetical protein